MFLKFFDQKLFELFQKKFLSLIRFLENIFLPIRCFGCQLDGTIFCDKCQQKFLRPKEPYPPLFARTLFSFEHPIVKKLIYALKYKRVRLVAKALAPVLGEEILAFSAELLPGEKILVVPIPASPKTKIKRGYAQAEILAKEAVENIGSAKIIYAPILQKIIERPSQTKQLNKKARLANVLGTFAITGTFPSGQVILVDDVLTSGATLTEARRTIRRAGLRYLGAVVVAG